MAAKRALPELERQKKYLSQLPKDFAFPLFNSRRALESQRQSGYRNTAAAARELVDNAIEAQADAVHIVFDRPSANERRAHERKNSVVAAAFIDNGSGMLPEMARYALSWGGGTHFDEHDFIGKFGFGLPNASINQTRRVEVYTRTSPDEPIIKAWLDIDEYTGEGVVQQIKAPERDELPAFVSRYLKEQKMTFDHGTVVVWVRPDRLTYKTAAQLRDHLLDDFGATYRYLLKDFELIVDGAKVHALDPLFLDKNSRFYRKPEDGGALLQYDETIPVALVEDETGEKHLFKVEDPKQLEEGRLLAAGGIHVRVARFPLGLVVGGIGEAGIQPLDEASANRFEIRKARRGISFVRAGREIETVDAFPKRASDTASGMGDWPPLQSYAYHYGIEVAFTSGLDPVFGITNDKQQVRPIEDFWRVMAAEEIDQLMRREDKWQRHMRQKAREQSNAAKAKATGGDSPSPAEAAAAAADVASGDRPTVPEAYKKDANLAFERKAQEYSRVSERSIEEARQAVADQLKKKKYAFDYFEEERGPFYIPEWIGTQVLVRVNKSHPFFTVIYGTLLSSDSAALAKEGIDVLLITLARAELQALNDETVEFYREQRENRWSPYLASALRGLAKKFSTPEEEDAAA